MARHCYGYNAMPLGLATEQAFGGFQSAKFPGIKPPRGQRLAPRPVSVDVKAVTEGQECCPTNAFQAATTLMEFERTKIEQAQRAPVRIDPPLGGFLKVSSKTMRADLVSKTGLTARRVRLVLANPELDASTREDYSKIARVVGEIQAEQSRQAVSIVRSTVTSEPLGDQILEQIRGVRSELTASLTPPSDVRAIELSVKTFETAERRSLQEKYRSLGSKPLVQSEVRKEREERGVPITGLSSRSKEQLIDELVRLRVDDRRSILVEAATQRAPLALQQFKATYDAQDETGKASLQEQIHRTIVADSGGTLEVVRAQYPDLQTSLDYLKDRLLPLPQVSASALQTPPASAPIAPPSAEAPSSAPLFPAQPLTMPSPDPSP